MNKYKNLADPDFEPSDEQLLELSRNAFAHIREENELRLQKMRERIATGRLELLKQRQGVQWIKNLFYY